VGKALAIEHDETGPKELADPGIDPVSMISESVDHQVEARRQADHLVDWFLH
tara:strand:+ start:617 stop:772 length:156 start_codon:yes stop_codon:yes gene_type:complete